MAWTKIPKDNFEVLESAIPEQDNEVYISPMNTSQISSMSSRVVATVFLILAVALAVGCRRATPSAGVSEGTENETRSADHSAQEGEEARARPAAREAAPSKAVAQAAAPGDAAPAEAAEAAADAASAEAAAADEPSASAPRHPALLDPSKANKRAPARYTAVLETTKGEVRIDVRRSWAPLGADRFYNLVDIGFLDDVAMFRVIRGFMAQGGLNGDPAVNAVWRQARIDDDPVEAFIADAHVLDGQQIQQCSAGLDCVITQAGAEFDRVDGVQIVSHGSMADSQFF